MASTAELIPRAYQEEIFNHARRENIVAALDTGSGKTYIAVLLIRWLASQYTGARKVYVFIVPRVPLVEQQREFIAQQVPLTVRGYYGALVDPWQHDPVRWTQEFNECDVMVMTAQIFLDAMLHAHWSMEQVALLVFDEAHHTRKNNPYNQIMRDFYYTCDRHHRPRVLGMTASPVWNTKNPLVSLRALEHNLHARVLGVEENVVELLEHSPRPVEIIQEYPIGDMTYPDYPTSLWKQLGALGIPSHPPIVHSNLDIRYDVTVEEVGPYGADFYLSSYLQAVVSDLVRKHRYDYLMTQDREPVMVDLFRDDRPEKMSVDSRTTELSTTLVRIETLILKFGQLVSFENSSLVLPQWISPKLRVLVSILLERRSSSFQGIVFVEQRQVAATLAWLLPRIPALKGWINAEALVGHGTGRGTASLSGMMDKKQQEILKAFRARTCNLLISTSVGEEGLDFQGCDLIVRYNQLQNMVGYLQSRGRARRFDSTYIIMVPEGSYADRMRYNAFRENEPVIRQFYQNRHSIETSGMMTMEEPDDAGDLAARERYEIPSTGAVLTFGSAISLLNNLCALIPRDKYTRVLQPQYTEESFQVTVVLPSALPIPRDRLVYHGAVRRTKREAKAAAAFMACKSLHTLGVFDDYLLPVRRTSGARIEDADGIAIPEVGIVNEMMDVLVHDPWSAWQVPLDDNPVGYHIWIHPLLLMGQTEAKIGLVTAVSLGHLPRVPCEEGDVNFMPPQQVYIPSYSELQVLQEYTRLGIRWCNTSKMIKDPLACLLTLLDSDGKPDLEQMRKVVRDPTVQIGSKIRREDEGRLLLQCKLEFGRPLLLRELREDLTPLSRPEGEFETYQAYFQKQYGGKKYPVVIPHDGPLVLVETFARNFSSRYRFSDETIPGVYEPPKKKQRFLPAGLCEAFVFPQHMIQTFLLLPQVIRRVTDIYRARLAVEKLGLPSLQEELVVEALTLPCAFAGFNNQRLETLGDSVLKLCVVVHLYNKYPFRHEGQLDGMRTNSVSNRVLLARAKEIGLESFLTSEPAAMRKWRPTSGDGVFVGGTWHAQRKFARRSLQDCMEALLGASFLTGGIDMALQTGTVLRLCFGGKEPWHMRYNVHPQTAIPTPLLFKNIHRSLGYEFECHELLLEAITHPSFQSDNACYQRLEFLGDALLDVIVMGYLFRKFPRATSGQLTWARSRAVMAPALATVAVKQLSLEKYILFNNAELGKALTSAIPEHINLSYEEVVLEGWKYDPPKALSDVMESVCGAILVDTGYDLERSRAIIEHVMEPLLEVLEPTLPRDPTSELMLFLARKGCQRAKFEKFASEPDKKKQSDAIRFLVHGVPIATAQRSPGNSLARIKPLLAQRVKSQFEDVNSEFYLERLCNCRAGAKGTTSLPEDINLDRLDDEKEEDFAILGTLTMMEVDGTLELMNQEKEDLEAEEEVQMMLLD